MKRGDVQLSFGMIFSIILIIVFITFAFWGIRKFLEMQDNAKIGIFVDELRNDVNKMWGSTIGSQQINYSLPSNVKFVCFAKIGIPSKGGDKEKYSEFELKFNEEENMFFYPVSSAGGLSAVGVDHLDIEELTSKDNPFCIPTKKGKLSLTIKKDYGNPLVLIEK